MAKIRTIQILRGTTAQNDAYSGSAGELTMDTEKKQLRIHDGLTPGGRVIGDELPDQTGHAGEILITNGTDASWSGAIGYHPDLFDHKWADHVLNDVSWLRADTFSWQAGSVYQAAYQHLADDIDGKTLQSETISGTTIQFYLADDGHKICPASEESNVAAIYAATGIAWYYILDIANQRFKLPRTKFGMTGLRDTVGNYVAPGLPNITSYLNASGLMDYRSAPATNWYKRSGAFDVYVSGNDYTDKGFRSGGAVASSMSLSFDASRSSSIYGNDTTVQPPATQMYLYFYVGNFTQTALENTAGLNAELFNGKADLNLSNTASNIDFVVERQEPTAANNYTWYRKYKSGWVEQGARYETNSNIENITFPVAFAAIPTIITAGSSTTRTGYQDYQVDVYNLTTTGFTKQYIRAVGTGWGWCAFGMAA